MDLQGVEDLILKGSYETASEYLFEFIDSYKIKSDLENLYNTLNLLNLICDKSPSIALNVVKIISPLVNQEDSWIRLATLEILLQVAIYRPYLLIDLIDMIKSRLYDNDSSVRRLAVKIVGKLILSLHIDSDELELIIEEYTEKLMDQDWKVKLLVIKKVHQMILEKSPPIENLEPLLSMTIINLRDEDDDVARSAAELLKTIDSHFLSGEKIFHILLNLLYNESDRVKELIIWLFGEIGSERSTEIIQFIPKIMNFLEVNDYRLQLKVINALINIAETNFDQIWANIVHSISETNSKSFRESLGNALYQLSQNHIQKVVPLLLEELEHPSENVRLIIALVFKRLFDEYQVEIENEITKILYRLESKYWRERKKAIQLLGNISAIVESEKISVWLTIELEHAIEIENDLDVRNEIELTLRKVRQTFPEIDKIIKKINEELKSFQEQIIEFQKLPAQFRIRLNSYIKSFKFNTTEIQLNQMYDTIIKRIQKFHDKINRFEYKRLAFDLLEEWEETKYQVIDELSIIKGFISDICEEKKEEFKSDLQTRINILMDRIEILKAQFDYIKANSLNEKIDDQWEGEESIKNQDLQESFNYISQIRQNLFKLDMDIREILLNNIEFDNIFKSLLSRWVAIKIEIQMYLNDLDRKIRSIKQQISEDYFYDNPPLEVSQFDSIDGLSNELTFQIIQGHIQSIISQGIEGIKKFNNNFDTLKAKLDLLISKSGFEESKRMIDMNSSQIKSFIEETEKQIDNVIEKENIFQKNNNIFNLYIRPFMEKWNASKELLIHKLKSFEKKSEDKLYLHQIKHYLKIMNPLDFELLSNYLGIESERLKDYVLNFISKNKLQAKVVNGSIYSSTYESEIPNFKEINLFKNIKTLGNKIILNLRINNPSNYDFRDLQIILRTPSYVNIEKEDSFPKFIHVDKLKSGSNFKFKFILKIDREIKQGFSEGNPDEINLTIHYKGPFDVSKRLSKKIDLLLS
ncbi:MAG: hypothetical protein GF317_02955 [Candidatus Lokiarchaeota archaeon]|nr:hypothetical protein [Candidatus Lokiarchaeota archaeon]MBD3198865.1 hypothetical protein [Candidatus Lokiarchaeota archaeon]